MIKIQFIQEKSTHNLHLMYSDDSIYFCGKHKDEDGEVEIKLELNKNPEAAHKIEEIDGGNVCKFSPELEEKVFIPG